VTGAGVGKRPKGDLAMLNNLVLFVREKYPYILGFFVIEAGIYYLNGPTGNFTTGFLGLFVIWIFYVVMSPK
jgi:hypothetical protein